MNRRYGVIDIGTLKVKSLVVELGADGLLNEVYKSNNLTCFGCDMNRNGGYVSDKDFEETLAELVRLKQLLARYRVKKLRVVSTHAMRKAKNREAIQERIQKELDWEVENISQEDEAGLFFLAAMRSFEQTNQKYAVVDVGGGSVQVLVGTPKKMEKSLLLPTGAGYLHAKFTLGSDLETSFTKLEDIEKMKAYIVDQLLPLQGESGMPIVYGSSNIIDLMKAIKLPMEESVGSKVHPYKVYAKHLNEFIEKVVRFNYAEREAKFEFQKGYMWGIDKAFLNIVTIGEYLDSPYIIPSNANIAQGIVWEMIQG